MVQLCRVERAERSGLDRLVDDYLSELAVHREIAAGPTTAASYQYLPLYWEESGRHPFFILAGRARVGFVLIREAESESIIEMSDFYIRPEFRRSGLGRAALSRVWQRFPGAWRLEVHPGNANAAFFWPHCIDEFASGNIQVCEVVGEDGRRLQYNFQIPTT
jgi:predicted acetyltransferase